MTEDNTCNVDIELTLEEWGQIALIAHGRNETINETIVYILQKAMDSLNPDMPEDLRKATEEGKLRNEAYDNAVETLDKVLEIELVKQWVKEDGDSLIGYLKDYSFEDHYTPTSKEYILLEDALNGWDAKQYEVWAKRVAKSQSQVSVLIRALYWILNNPGAHRANIRSVVLEALSKTEHSNMFTNIQG